MVRSRMGTTADSPMHVAERPTYDHISVSARRSLAQATTTY
jgi:hypothetical protein